MSEQITLAQALATCQGEKAKELVSQLIEANTPVEEILRQCNEGMVELGNRFSRGESFIPDLMLGGMILKDIMGQLEPLLKQAAGKKTEGKPTAVIGTVQYDIHDIGKDIVVMLLEGAGFNVVDLGVDVPPERFAEAVRESGAEVMGMSVLLTTCYDSVVKTVEAVKQAGLRDQVKIMVGGAAASQLLCEQAGCDFYGKTAVDGLHYARSVVAGSNAS